MSTPQWGGHNKDLPSGRRVGNVHRLQGSLLPHTNTKSVQEVSTSTLSFGLSTAPIELTVVGKEVKLMTLHKGIRIHQYLEDWLARAHQTFLQHTQTLVTQCQELSWMANMEK